MADQSWGNLSLKEKVRIRTLDKNPSLGNVVLKTFRDGGDYIDVRSNSLGLVAWVFGLTYNKRSPDSKNGNSIYAVPAEGRPGFMPSVELEKSLNEKFNLINYREHPQKGDVGVIRCIPGKFDYGYSPIVDAGICTESSGDYHIVFGQDDFSPYHFQELEWEGVDFFHAGFDIEFYRRK
jgi:hypothetical protein